MSESYPRKHDQLQQLMQQAGINSIKQLSELAGVPELQIIRLQYGLLPKMSVETLLKVAQALQISLSQLLSHFDVADPQQEHEKALKQEYQRLQQQMQHQREELLQEFQANSLQTLESWLLQWPTAAAAAENNPQLPAVRLLPLVKPVEQLLQQWGVTKIAAVGETVAYDPQRHQLIEGTAEPGEQVKVRYAGYRQGDKLLYRVKVSPCGTGKG
ncbi:MAG: helix-turn-helix domain-containing protein [Cyanophyceae cyanobacterium]